MVVRRFCRLDSLDGASYFSVPISGDVKESVNESLLFVQRFLKSSGKVGSVVPSSKYLVRAIIEKIPFETSATIVELGGGTGTITDALVKKKNDKSALLVFEPDDQFFGIIEKKYSGKRGVTILQKKAQELLSTLRKMNAGYADCIVSSIPFASLGRKTSGRILAEIQRSLAPGGSFILYQYTVFTLPLILKYFRIRKFSYVVRNVPPALVFVCSSKKHAS